MRNVQAPILGGDDAEEIMHFSLQGILPLGHTLALNTILGTAAHMACEQDLPLMLMEQQFTPSELLVFLPLLDSFPYYCPVEMLHASFTIGRVTKKAVARSRERLQEAKETGVWDQEMRPVRNVLSRTRIKLRPFGIGIASILEIGYILKPMPVSSNRYARG